MASILWLGLAVLHAFTAQPAHATDITPGTRSLQLGLQTRASTLPGGGHPFALVTTDLNGDGHVDLAVSNPAKDTVSVYLGRGDGTFAPHTDVPTGDSPRGVMVGDFNGDGKLDLGVAATDDNSVAIHSGTGDGTFTPPQLVRVGQRPFLGTVADLNEDNLLDLAVANEGAKVSVLLGNGRGQFGVESYESAKSPSDVAAADFNGDGHLDLAVTNWGANNVSLLLGKGDGTFGPPRNFTYAAGGYKHHALYCVLAVDLDRDGRLDMVWNDILGKSLYLLYGDGAGEFPRHVLVPAGAGVRSAVAVDLNDDGWLDLASANTAANSVSIMLADTRGEYVPTQYVGVGVHPRMLRAADVSGDERLDLIVTNTKSNDLTVLLNEGMGYVPVQPHLRDTPREQAADIRGLDHPAAVAIDAAGNVLIADQRHHRIAKLDPRTGTITTIAGTGKAGSSGDGGPANQAMLNSPASVAVDAAGAIYIADFGNNRVRKVATAGTISTIAGTGEAEFRGDGGVATQATVGSPYSVALDRAGVLYIAEFGSGRIRKVDTKGTMSTVAGTGTPGYSGDGGPGTAAAVGIGAKLAVDSSGDLLIADPTNRCIRRLDSTGVIRTIAGRHVSASPVAGAATAVVDVGVPSAIAADLTGVVYVTDQIAQAVRRLTPAGAVEAVAQLGAVEPGKAPGRTWSPSGIALDAAGNMFVSDTTCGCIHRIDPSGRVATLAPAAPTSPAPLSEGHAAALEYAKPTPGRSYELRLDWEYGFRSGSDANAASAVAIAPDGAIYVAGDVGSGADWKVVRLTPDGKQQWSFDFATPDLELPAAIALTPNGQVVTAGHRTGYSVADTRRDYVVISVSRDGSERWRYTMADKGDQIAWGIAADAKGNLYVAGESDRRLEVFSLTTDGKKRWEYRGETGAARAIAVGERGDVLVAGNDHRGWRVLKLSNDGKVRWDYQEATQQTSSARAIAVDRDGNVVVAGLWRPRRKQLRVIQLDPDGRKRWEFVDPTEPAFASALALDRDGNAIVVGETTQDWLMLSVDRRGQLRWRFTHDGGGKSGNQDQAFALAVDSADGFVVSGLVHPLPPKPPSRGQVDWRVARYHVQ